MSFYCIIGAAPHFHCPMANLASEAKILASVVGLIALALAPLAFLAWFFYAHDTLAPEPQRLVLKIFLLGVLAFIPAFLGDATIWRFFLIGQNGRSRAWPSP